MHRALIVGVLALSLVATGAGPASAKIASGKFAGTTSKGDKVGFKVDGKGRVYSLYFVTVMLTCTDGDTVETPPSATDPDKGRVETPKRFRFAVNKARRFGVTARNETTGFGWDAKGRFNRPGRTASGTLSIFATYNDENQQDPNGNVRCESGELTWEATRALPRRRRG